ncbi:MAG: hypothetical protein AAGF33_01310 [Pseudomonadota bacterium]
MIIQKQPVNLIFMTLKSVFLSASVIASTCSALAENREVPSRWLDQTLTCFVLDWSAFHGSFTGTSVSGVADAPTEFTLMVHDCEEANDPTILKACGPKPEMFSVIQIYGLNHGNMEGAVSSRSSKFLKTYTIQEDVIAFAQDGSFIYSRLIQQTKDQLSAMNAYGRCRLQR